MKWTHNFKMSLEHNFRKFPCWICCEPCSLDAILNGLLSLCEFFDSSALNIAFLCAEGLDTWKKKFFKHNIFSPIAYDFPTLVICLMQGYTIVQKQGHNIAYQSSCKGFQIYWIYTSTIKVLKNCVGSRDFSGSRNN